MEFRPANDTEGASLVAELGHRASDTDASGLRTANLWLWYVERAAADPRAVVSALMGDPGMPRRDLLVPHAEAAPWVPLTGDQARRYAVRLLVQGACLEVPTFGHDPAAADQFVERLLGWLGDPVAGLGSMEYRSDGPNRGFYLFRLPHWVDEGLVLVGLQRIGLLWFVGTD